MPLEVIENSISEKVRKRIRINLAGLNGLATTIVPPQLTGSINERDLVQILSHSNKINHLIGLPNACDLIIRTSSKGFDTRSGQIAQRMSEPALLITGLPDHPKFRLLGQDSDIRSFHDFYDLVPHESFFLIHDDNYQLQTQGIHGSYYEGPGGLKFI